MPPQLRKLRPDLVISRIAATQHGIVERSQLLEAGLSAAMIRTRLEGGRLHPVHRGVYSLSPMLSERARQQAALLACGPPSVLSHRSAASIWNLSAVRGGAIQQVTLPPGTGHRRSGIAIRRAVLMKSDVRVADGLRVTGPARTVADLATLLGEGLLEHVASEAVYRRLTSEAELAAQLDRYPGRPGHRALRKVLDLDSGPERTRSSGERALLRLLRTSGISGFETNARVAGYEVDFLWRDAGVAVELDGWDGHRSRSAFERDRKKWAELGAAGIQVMPITGRQLRDDAPAVLRRLNASLTRRRAA